MALIEQAMENGKAANFSRLPKNLVPNHYYLIIRPEIGECTFSGSEIVNVQVCETTKTISLNSLDIAIQSASFVTSDQEHLSVKIELNKENETAVITFANELKVGAGKLKLQFTGHINNLPIGCYRDKYKDAGGEERYELATHFEGTSCRRAFPCWDEPAIKAKFDLTLITPKDRVALSNMPVIEETDDPVDSSKRMIKFATTPIMSTYSLAYVIGEYEYIEKRSKNGVAIRVYTAPGKTVQGKFSLKMAIRFLNFHDSYPLPKLDLVAFAGHRCNLIETWGLITCPEFLIFTDCRSTHSFAAAMVFASLATQSFGNLVTKDSSKNSWINKALSHFMTTHSEDQLVPEANARERFVADILTSALNLDALHSSYPIEVNNPNEVYDEMSCWKGASVIHMLYDYLGDKAFKKGVHSYLNKWAHENVITEDLWSSLEEAGQKPVRSFVSAWSQQKGYPLIHVTSRQDVSNRVLTLVQEKFSMDGVLSEEDRQIVWPVPIRIVSQGNNEPFEILLEKRSQDVVLKGVKSSDWVKLNAGFTSFCRVNYPPDMLRLFEPSIVDKSLSGIDRLNILIDLFALVQRGMVKSDRFLDLMKAYKLEDRCSIWRSILDCLRKFSSVLEYTDFQELFYLYARMLLADICSKLGNRPALNEREQDRELRPLVRGFLASCKDPRQLQEAKAWCESRLDRIKKNPQFLTDSIIKAAAADCNETIFETFFQLCHQPDVLEKDRLFQSLGASRDPVRIDQLIKFAMSDEVRSEDAIHAFVSIATSNKVGREIAWNYYKENHELFNKKFESEALLCQLIKNLTENFALEEHLHDVSAHFQAHPVACAERTVQQSLESIKANADWLARDSQIIRNYLTRLNEL